MHERDARSPPRERWRSRRDRPTGGGGGGLFRRSRARPGGGGGRARRGRVFGRLGQNDHAAGGGGGFKRAARAFARLATATSAGTRRRRGCRSVEREANARGTNIAGRGNVRRGLHRRGTAGRRPLFQTSSSRRRRPMMMFRTMMRGTPGRRAGRGRSRSPG